MKTSRNKAVMRAAAAILDAAAQRQVVEAVEQDFRNLSQALAGLAPQRLPHQFPVESLQSSFAEPFTFQAVERLAHFGMMPRLQEVCEVFLEMLEARRGKLVVEITSAKPLNDAQRQTLLEKLGKRLQQEIIPQWSVDESLLGGFTYRTENVLGDYSAKGMLERMKQQLLA